MIADGATTNEIPRIREAGDLPDRRAIPLAGAPDAGTTRHSARHLPPVVRSLPDRWRGSAGGSQPTAWPGLEPHSRSRAGSDYRPCPGQTGAIAARIGGD